MSTLSWQAGNASGSFLTGTIIQALITVNFPNYTGTNWQGTLFVFAMVLVLLIVNIWGAPLWAVIQNGLMVLHILFFLIVIIILWVMAPHQTAKAVFTEFSNNGGWSSMGLSVMVGQITAIYSLLGMQNPYAHLLCSSLTGIRFRCNGPYR
jgi:amino acid transporter